MGPIQSGVNQSLAILSLASSQSPKAQANRQATSDTNAFNKYIKTDQKTPFALGEKSEEMFKGLQEQAIESNLKAGRTKDLVNISKVKPETENIKDDIKEMALNYLDPESAEEVVNTAFKGIKGIEQKNNSNITSKEVRDRMQNVIGIVSERLSTKKRIKVNMNMMKSALKEDN